MKTKVNRATHTSPAVVSSQSNSTNATANCAQSAQVPNDEHEQVSPKQTRPKTKPKARSSQKRKRRKTSSSSNSSSCEESIDPAIEKKLKQSALRNNLTHENIKNILHKVVRNDHVLAIVKLKEEELEKQEQAKKSIEAQQDDDEDGPTSLPKLTRAKAKALNKQPLPLAPLKSTQPDSEVVALISEELRSDDDDEEYQPGDDDIETDDDFNTTASDIDSQPRTPQTPSSHIEPDEDTTPRATYTKDGLFKVPRARNESITSQSEHEYIIAQRTRSKVNLAETPIEAIESNFKPPDVPIDFYGSTDLDPDDLPWSEFMWNYRFDKAPDHEEDEDGDPDYIAADKAPVDKEELRQPKVPKKELEDLLVAHEIDASDNNFWNDFLSIEFGEQSNDAPNTGLLTPVKSDACPAEMAADKLLEQASASAGQMAQSMSPPFFDLLQYTSPIDLSGQCDQRSFASQANNALNFDVAKHANPAFAPNGLDAYQHSGSSYNLNSTPNFAPAAESNTSPAPNARQFVLVLPPANSAPTTVTQVNLPLNTLSRQIESGGFQQAVRPKRTRFKKDRFGELENLDPQHIVARKVISPAARGFTTEQQLIFEQQLRMHVQLTTQNFMQTYGHPEHYARAWKFKRFLTELQEMNKGNEQITNLQPALALINEWETELSIDSTENTELIHHIQGELDKLRSNLRYEMRFHERWLKKVCHSTVFLYPSLLPTVPFRFETKKVAEYLPSEDYLIAFELERYYSELSEKIPRYKLLKPKPVSLVTVCKYISANFCYLRNAKSIYDYVRLRRANFQPMNPIKFYFLHKLAPVFEHRLIPYDDDCLIEPAKRTLPELPKQFAKYVEKLVGAEHDKLLSSFVPTNSKAEASPTKPFNYRSRTFIEDEVDANSTRIDDIQDKSFSVEVICRNVAASHPPPPCHCHFHHCHQRYHQHDRDASSSLCMNCSRCTSICDYNDPNTSRYSRSVSKGQTLLTSYFSVLERKSSSSSLPPPNANFSCDDLDQVADSENSSNDPISLNRCRVKIVRKYLHLNSRKSRHRRQLQLKLVTIIRDSKRACAIRWRRYRHRPLIFTFICLDTYHKYTAGLMKMNGTNAPVGRRPSTAAANRPAPIDVVVANKRVQKIVNDVSDEGNAKRLTKGNRIADNARMMLMYDNQESAEKDMIFAQHYFDRVEETFANENNHQKHNEFLTILRCFDNSEENAADLYRKLERFFAPDHLELADMFLYFLRPSDAIEIGKFMEHFLYTNMSKFISRLNVFYQKQPAQMRKVWACLKELSEEEDVKMEKVRNKIMPLLKGNQLLVDWFLQCMGTETSENNSNIKDEYETISCRKAVDAVDDDLDAYEHIPQSEIFPDPNDNPCGVRIVNGHVYANRTSIPAKLSFSIISSSADRCPGGVATPKTTSCMEAKSHDHEKDSATPNASYRCVHDIREFGNVKINVKSRNVTETDQTDGAALEEGDDSEDDQQVVDVKLPNSNDEKYSDSGWTHLLCDDKMLKAHGIRLNPSAHSSMTYNNVEMLNMLKPSDCVADSNRDCKLSPKKQALKTSTHAKPPRKYSPNAKKANCSHQSSPNRKNCSPPSAQLQHMHSAANKLTSDSPAIQTAKKLKRILETCSGTDDKTDNTACTTATTPANTANATIPAKRNLPSTPTTTHKIRRFNRTTSTPVDHPSGTAPKLKSVKVEKIEDDRHLSTDEKPAVAEASHSNEVDGVQIKSEVEKPAADVPIKWSRDEDRLLLEHIKDGLESNHEFITQITHEFPTKNADNVKERIDFLIDFLTKLRNIT